MSTPPTARRATDRGYALALAAAAVLSLTGILIRHLGTAHGLPPLELTFWRSALVVLTLGPWLAARSPGRLRLGRAALGAVLGLGASLGAMNVLWTCSVARVGAALGTVLIYTSGAFTALLGALLLGERLGLAKVGAAAACLAGTALVAGLLGGGQGAGTVLSADPLGVALGVLSGLAYAAYGLAGRAAARRGVDAFTGVLYAFAIGGGLTGALLALLGALQPGSVALLRLGADAAGWADLLLLAAGPTVIGFGLYGRSLTLLPASVANLVLTLEPPLTAAIAWALLGERLTGAAWAGSALILSGLLVLRLSEGRRPPSLPLQDPPDGLVHRLARRRRRPGRGGGGGAGLPGQGPRQVRAGLLEHAGEDPVQEGV